MKSTKGMSFGFSAVVAGQRNQSVEPQVLAVSTEGGFRVTPMVSRVLGLTPGDYVMFISNLNQIEQAIAAKDEVVVAYCEENGLALGTPEALLAIHKEFDMWAIAKGIVEYDVKGNAKEATERLSKKDKMRFVMQNFDEMLAAALEEADDEVKDALQVEGITREEQADILTAFVQPKTVTKYKGSKTANPAGQTGSGLSLTFTDSNVWKQLKAGMGDEATTMNRIFDVDIEDVQTIMIDNGYEEVEVKALVLGEYTDKKAARVGQASDDAEEAED